MSKIEKELVKATDVSAKRGEDAADYRQRLWLGVKALNDKGWDALSDEAQDWYNNAAQAFNANKKDPNPKFELPDFPDADEKAKEEPARARRRDSDDEGDAKAASAENLKVGLRVKLTNKRGKVYEGEVVEIDKKVVVVKSADGEDEIDLERLDKVEIFHGTAGSSEPDEPEIAVGVIVKLINKRGREVVGKIIELTDDLVALDVDGKEEEFNRDRVESITPVDGAKDKADDGKRSTRAKADDKADAKDDKKPRASNAPGTSIGQRIKELIAEDIDADEAAIGKALKKENIAFAEATLHLNYVECHKMVSALKAAKKLK